MSKSIDVKPSLKAISDGVATLQVEDTYQRLIKPNQGLLRVVAAIALLEIAVLALPNASWVVPLEGITGLSLTIAVTWAASRLFKGFFDFYLLNAAIKSGRKINSELLILLKWLFNRHWYNR